jgi:uncharacterized protein YijF (DUF1287 family)
MPRNSVFSLLVFLSLIALGIFLSLTTLVSCEKENEKKREQTEQNKTEPAFKYETDVVDELPSSSIPAEPVNLPEPPAPPMGVIEQTVEKIPRELSFAEKLVQAALERTTHDVTYDGRYQKIAYPMGDVADSIGVCTDVVIRSYRELGIDLQQLVHEDIRKNFKLYPNQKRWGLTRPDTNIDHRRVPNLRVFFKRHGQSLPVTNEPADYLPGDMVTWKLSEKMVHIGIVSDQKSLFVPNQYLIIHNIGRGPELGDMLFDYEITGHYRYGFDDNEG